MCPAFGLPAIVMGPPGTARLQYVPGAGARQVDAAMAYVLEVLSAHGPAGVMAVISC
jgi:hypothetical protein